MRVFNVAGMTCGHCERAVIQAIQAKDPGARVTVDLSAGTVAIDSTLDDQAIREAISDEGYQVD